MTENATFYPSDIGQPQAGQRKYDPFPCCTKAVDRSGEYEGYYCADTWEKRYYHEWSNAIELTRGGEISCGRESNYNCDYETYFQIAGYRNTCPIAGCSGTFFQPSTLFLGMSKSHLDNYDIIEGSEIESVTLTFNHRSLGCDVSDGSLSTNWGPNFCGFDKYPDLQVLRIYVVNKDYQIRGNVCVHNQNPPLKGYAGVSATIKGLTYEDIADGWIVVEYQRNLSTNPGNIYIRDLKISVNYSNSTPAMYGVGSLGDLYTSKYDDCCSTGRILIDATFENSKGRVPMSKWKYNIKDDIIVEVPDGVTYTTEDIAEHRFYHITDKSNKAGVKNVVFRLKNTDYIYIAGYKAIKHKKPSVNARRVIYKNHIPPENALTMTSEGCVKKAEFFINGYDTDPIVTLTEDDFDSTKDNIIKQSASDRFYTTLADTLGCGTYKLFIKLNGDDYYRYDDREPIYIQIRVPEFEWETYIYSQNPEDTNPINTPLEYYEFLQNKQNNTAIIKIKRVDNFPTRWDPTFDVYTDINYHNHDQNTLPTINKGLQDGTFANAASGDSVLFDVSLRFPGRYSVHIKDADSSYQRCETAKKTVYIDVHGTHKQNHDEVFVRGEDSTSFDYDYLVAWEGDNIDEPISVSEVTVGSSFNDIKVCVEAAEFYTGISQMGLAKIKVTNVSDRTLNNVRLELNVLLKNDDGDYEVSLNEFLASDGMFKYLETNFYRYNKEYVNNLFVLNTPGSIDDDYIGEENVQFLIKTLEYDKDEEVGDTVEIVIPFISRSEKTAKIQLLVFEEVFPLHLYYDCEFSENTFYDFNLTVFDSILTDINIEGETDLLEIDQANCPQECYKTELTYKIRNIDSSETEDTYTRTEITNDSNLIPYKVKLKGSPNPIMLSTIENLTQEEMSEEQKRVQWSHKEKTKVKELGWGLIDCHVHFPGHEKYTLTRRTDRRGQVIFEIRMPNSVSRSYTLDRLLQEVLRFEYGGNIELSTGVLYIDDYGNVVNLLEDVKDKNQVVFNYQHTYKRYKANDLVRIVLNVTYLQKYFDNTLVFYPNIQIPGREDEITVYYKICNLEETIRNQYNQERKCYNRGLLHTKMSTNDYQLIKNSASKDIYCGLDTDLKHEVSIEKYLVEQNEINYVNIEIKNNIRDNKEIKCLIDLGSHIDVGTYEIVEINVDDGTAQVIEAETPQIDWLIGEMKADSVTHAQIILKGGEVGLNDISIGISDFLTGGNYHFCQRACQCGEPKHSNITIYKPAEGDVYDEYDIIEVEGYLLDDDDEPINNQTVNINVNEKGD